MFQFFSEPDRTQRLALRDYGLDHSPAALLFDDLMKLSRQIAGTSASAVALQFDTRQRLAAFQHWPGDAMGDWDVVIGPRILDETSALEVPDTAQDDRVADLLRIRQDNGLRYFATFPIISAGGLKLGTLCLADIRPHRLSSTAHQQLCDLTSIAASLLESHRAVHHRQRTATLMQLQTSLLHAAAMGRSIRELADRLLRFSESLLPGARTLLTIATEDKKRLYWVSSPALPQSFSERLSNVEIASDASTCAVAAKSRQMIYSQDVRNDATWFAQKDTFLQFGILAFWVVPLFSKDGRLVGTFSVYLEGPGLPTDPEVELLTVCQATAVTLIELELNLRKLVQSENMLREAQEIARLGAYSIEIESGLRFGSAIANEILGMPRDNPSMTLEQYQQLIHHDDLPVLARTRQHSIDSGIPIAAVFRIARKSDGALRWVEGRALPIKDIDGRITRYAGTLLDITERREAELALRLNQRAVESSSNGVLIVDARAHDLPVIYVNPAFESISGYRKTEILGRNCRILQGAEVDQAGLRDIRHAIRQQQEGQALLHNFRKDGSDFWIDLRIAPVKDESGKVTHFVGFQTNFTDRIRYEQALAYQASHDTLTGLANRSLLQDRIEQALLMPRSGMDFLAVVFIDLDRFKLINDSLGHAVGDLLLKDCAKRILALVKPGDTVARMGGDEFVVLLNRVQSLSDIRAQVNGMLRTIQMPYLLDGNTLTVSASAGIALSPEHGSSGSVLLRHADIAMYNAKSLGRANCQVFTEDLSSDARRRLEIKEELIQALLEKQFCLHYQPKFHALTGELAGFEALVRWNHPRYGLLYPDRFIKEAEEFGLIAELGTWVLEEACSQVMKWCQSTRRTVSVAVNISIAQFRNGQLVDEVERVLRENQMAPGCLELEITESLAMENPEEFFKILRRLRLLGVSISVDDFGTGFSSLSFVKNFPLDFLKIDKSFVRDISTDPSDAAMCETIIVMAHKLGLKTIAEGVETAAQADFLRLNKCDILQGYLFAKPQTSELAFEFFMNHVATT